MKCFLLYSKVMLRVVTFISSWISRADPGASRQPLCPHSWNGYGQQRRGATQRNRGCIQYRHRPDTHGKFRWQRQFRIHPAPHRDL